MLIIEYFIYTQKSLVRLKCICGLNRISNGQVEYNRQISNQDFSVLPSIGVIIQNHIFGKDKTGYETLEFLGSIKNKITKEKIISVLDKVGLKDFKDIKIKNIL